jgi:hypothetical protein
MPSGRAITALVSLAGNKDESKGLGHGYEISALIFKEYPAACCGDSQETVLRKAAYSAFND